MDEIDELLEKSKQMEAEKQEKLKAVDKAIADRIAQEAESRERLSKAIGEKFATGEDAKGKVFLEMKKDLEDKKEAEMLRKRREIAESLGMDIDQFEQYLKLRGGTEK